MTSVNHTITLTLSLRNAWLGLQKVGNKLNKRETSRIVPIQNLDFDKKEREHNSRTWYEISRVSPCWKQRRGLLAYAFKYYGTVSLNRQLLRLVAKFPPHGTAATRPLAVLINASFRKTGEARTRFRMSKSWLWTVLPFHYNIYNCNNTPPCRRSLTNMVPIHDS